MIYKLLMGYGFRFIMKFQTPELSIRNLVLDNPTQSLRRENNIYRDRGSPCLIPLEGLKFLVGAPFMRIEKKIVEVIFIIHLIHPW